MCHRIGHRNQVGFRAKADLASGPAANDLERLTRLRLWQQEEPTVTSTDGRRLAVFFLP